MLYGPKCWPITKAQVNRVEVAKLGMMRWTCGKTMVDMIPNGVFRAELDVDSIIDKMREGRLRWFVHVKRRPQTAPIRRVEALLVDGSRRRGTRGEIELRLAGRSFRPLIRSCVLSLMKWRLVAAVGGDYWLEMKWRLTFVRWLPEMGVRAATVFSSLNFNEWNGMGCKWKSTDGNVKEGPTCERSWVTLGRLLPHARGLGFKPCRGGFSSEAKKEWGLSPKAKVRVLHTAQLDVTVSSNH
nr:polyprotein, putative [Tanacetum cinerariifolium]